MDGRLMRIGFAAAVVMGAAASALAKEPIVVTADRAKVMRIQAPAATIIIGNPGIADAAIQDRQTLVLTGRRAGTTNLVILDKKGEPIADEIVVVEASEAGLVIVQRGGLKSSYACTPICAPTLVAGDDTRHFSSAQQAINAVNQNAAEYSGAGPR